MILDLPSPKAEEWRWSDLSALPEIAARAPAGALPEALPWLAVEGPRLLFVDGRLAADASRLGPIAFGPVDRHEEDHALARLVGPEGWVLRLERRDVPLGLVQVVHVSTGGAELAHQLEREGYGAIAEAAA